MKFGWPVAHPNFLPFLHLCFVGSLIESHPPPPSAKKGNFTGGARYDGLGARSPYIQGRSQSLSMGGAHHQKGHYFEEFGGHATKKGTFSRNFNLKGHFFEQF